MKAVLFDLDGVITDTAEYHFLAWQALAQELNIAIDRTFNEQLKGVSRLDSLKLILAHGQQLDKFSDAEIAALAARKNNVYVEMIQKMTQADILPGILLLLQALKAANYKIALASASKNGPMILAKLGLTNYFDAIANPDGVAQGKPAPDIFLKAAELIQVSPSECVGVEDALSGVKAIKAAGMTAVAVGDLSQFQQADYVVAETADLTVAVLEKTWQLNHTHR